MLKKSPIDIVYDLANKKETFVKETARQMKKSKRNVKQNQLKQIITKNTYPKLNYQRQNKKIKRFKKES